MLSKKTIQYLSSIFLSIAFHLLSDEASHLWTDLWIFNHENLRKQFFKYDFHFKATIDRWSMNYLTVLKKFYKWLMDKTYKIENWHFIRWSKKRDLRIICAIFHYFSTQNESYLLNLSIAIYVELLPIIGENLRISTTDLCCRRNLEASRMSM